MSEYTNHYRLVDKECKGCHEIKKIETRSKYCSRACSNGSKRGKKTQEEIRVITPVLPEAVSFGPPKVLLFDIETFPNLSWVWKLYEDSAIETEQYSMVACIAAKWLGSEDVMVQALPDFTNYLNDPTDERGLLGWIWNLLDEADYVIAHNGDKFDIKKLNARFVINGFEPPSPYRSIDTLKEARKYFKFESNRLNSLAEMLGIGTKIETGGKTLWMRCIKGDLDAWDLMREYNIQDVVLLEKVYLRLRPWMKNHPDFNLYMGSSMLCPRCGSSHVQRRGKSRPKPPKGDRVPRAQCQSCKGWGEIIGNKFVRLKSA